MSAATVVGPRVRRPRLRIDWSLIALAIVLLLAVGVSGSIMFPPRTSIHTAIRTMHYNRGGIVVNPHARGCGTYWNTAHVGYGVGATVQIAAGFCWNGKDVRSTWGLRRNDCAPRATVLVVVDMTCRITGGHNGGYMDVRYEAHIRSAIVPYMQTTIVREVLVTPQGYLLQIPGQA
jgi:hypothetical protein